MPDLNRELRLAVCQGDIQAVAHALQAGADIRHQNYYAIRWAARKGYLDMLRWLQTQIHDITECLPDVVIAAIRGGQLIIVDYLVKTHDVTIRDNHNWAEIVVSAGNVEILNYLLPLGIDIASNIPQLLNLAAEADHAAMVMRLIDWLESPSTEIMADALNYIVCNGNLELLQDIHHRLPELDFLCLPDNILVSVAAECGHNDILLWLISLGVNLTADDNAALILAAQNNHVSILKILQKQSVDLTAQSSRALRAAVSRGCHDTAKFLIRAGCDIHEKNDHCLSLALELADVILIGLLLDAGASKVKLHRWLHTHPKCPSKVKKFVHNWLAYNNTLPKSRR